MRPGTATQTNPGTVLLFFFFFVADVYISFELLHMLYSELHIIKRSGNSLNPNFFLFLWSRGRLIDHLGFFFLRRPELLTVRKIGFMIFFFFIFTSAIFTVFRDYFIEKKIMPHRDCCETGQITSWSLNLVFRFRVRDGILVCIGLKGYPIRF